MGPPPALPGQDGLATSTPTSPLSKGASRRIIVRRRNPPYHRSLPQWAHQIFVAAFELEHLSAGASAGSEPGAQEGGGLIYGGSRGAGFAERIEQHEVVDDAVVADRCDGHAC